MKNKKILDDTEKRSYKVFLAYNEKMLLKAKETGDVDKIELYINNIKLYKELLGIEQNTYEQNKYGFNTKF